MPTQKYDVNLRSEERQQLMNLIHKGIQPTRLITRAHILLLADEGRSRKDIAHSLHCTPPTVTRICQRYCNEGLTQALHDKPRSGAPRKTERYFEAGAIP